MASNLHYDIIVTVHFNEFDLDSLDPTILAFNKVQYNATNIGLFIQTKTLLNSKEPLAQLRLNQIPEYLVEGLNDNMYYLEVSIYQGAQKYYSNFYNVISASSEHAEETPRLGRDLVNSNIILKSLIMSRMEVDKNLTDLQVEVRSDIGYIKSRDLVYNKLPSALINSYGDCFKTYNRCDKYVNKTAYKTLSFLANTSNLDNIEYMHNIYPTTLNHCLYGFDEGFDARSTSNITELLFIDLNDADTWLDQSSECVAFENDADAVAQSEPTVFFDGNYFPTNFLYETISSRKVVKNIINGSTYKIDPAITESIKTPIFNKIEKGNSISVVENKNSNTEFLETTLSETDFALQQRLLIELYNKKPKIYTVNYSSGCPYDTGRLGRNSNLPPMMYNLTVSADIRFILNPNNRDVQEIKEMSEKIDPFLCTVELKTLSYD